MLLADIRRIFDEKAKSRLSTEELISALVDEEDRPWCDFREQGHRIGARQLARLLKVFGIRPGTVRIGDNTPKGYMRAWFEDAFDRYLPSDTLVPDPSATPATIRSINGIRPGSSATASATPHATDLQQGSS